MSEKGLAEQLTDALGTNALKAWLERVTPPSYEVFVSRLYLEIETIIKKLQSSANIQYQDEDNLTIQITHMLSQRDYDATHDQNIRGHVDIVVKKNNFTWIGEAKTFSTSYEWLFKGMLQLITRYSTGSYNETEGALIIYFFDEKVKTKMESWKTKLQDEYSQNTEFINKIRLNSVTDVDANTLRFISSHTHPISELEMNVQHIPVMLYFDPQDPKIGRDKEKIKVKKSKNKPSVLATLFH